MEFTLPVINQIILHASAFPKSLLSFDRVPGWHKTNHGCISLRYADFTVKVTRSGYVVVHLFNNINFYYNNLETGLLPVVCEFITLNGNRAVEEFTYGVKNIQIACASNLRDQELLNHFRNFYGSHFPVGYEVFIVDTEGVPLSLCSPVLSYKSLRVKITRYSDRAMRCVFNFTYTGKVTVVLSALSDLPSVRSILEGWGSIIQ